MSLQTSKQMVKEICHYSISLVATQRIEYKEEICRDKRQCVATEHEKNVISQLKQRNILLRQGLSIGCQQQKEPVATLERGRKQKFYRDKVFYVTTRN